MKLLQELLQLNESVTFMPGVWEDWDDEHGKRKVMSGAKWWRKEKMRCRDCEYHSEYHSKDGEFHPDPHCDVCHGSGEEETTVSDAPELNVANDNAHAILDFLEYDRSRSDDLTGHWEKNELPEIRRKLLRLKNTGFRDLLAEPTDNEKERKTVVHKDEDGNHRIGKDRIRMIGGGRSIEQVKSYVDRLLDIIEFAQKNGEVVYWG